MRKYLLFFVSLPLLCFVSISQSQSIENSKPTLSQEIIDSTMHFDEIWAYLMQGEEHFFDLKLKIIDICYFAATVNNFGELVEIPNRSKIQNFSGRVHLCLALVA